jgi:hypothetical protein
VKKAAKLETNLTKALNGYGKTVERIGTESYLCAGSDTLPYAASGEGRRISAILRKAAKILGLAEHNESVVAGGIYVLSGDILTLEAVNRLSESLEHSIGLLGWVCDDNTLSATVSKACYGIFMRHAARKTKHVEKSVIVGCVREETATAYCGSKIGIMHCDNSLKSCLLIVDEQYLFMTVFAHFCHCVHNLSPYTLFYSRFYLL